MDGGQHLGILFQILAVLQERAHLGLLRGGHGANHVGALLRVGRVDEQRQRVEGLFAAALAQRVDGGQPNLGLPVLDQLLQMVRVALLSHFFDLCHLVPEHNFPSLLDKHEVCDYHVIVQ